MVDVVAVVVRVDCCGGGDGCGETGDGAGRDGGRARRRRGGDEQSRAVYVESGQESGDETDDGWG